MFRRLEIFFGSLIGSLFGINITLPILFANFSVKIFVPIVIIYLVATKYVSLLLPTISALFFISLISKKKFEINKSSTLVFIGLLMIAADFWLGSLISVHVSHYKGYNQIGRFAGLFIEPSYFAEYILLLVFIFHKQNFILKSFIILILGFILTQSFTILFGYFLIISATVFLGTLRKYLAIRPNIFLVTILFFVLYFIFERIGLIQYTWSEHGSWRTISNLQAIKTSGIWINTDWHLGLGGKQLYGIDWLVMVFSFMPIFLVSFGYVFSALFLIFIHTLLKKRYLTVIDYAAIGYWMFFSPKWNLMLLLLIYFYEKKNIK